MIAGVIPAPSIYAPRENPDLAEAKREVELDKMLQQGYNTPKQHAEAMAQRVWLLAKGAPPASATVVYPPEQVQPKYPEFVDYVERYLLAKYGSDKVFRGGLRVQTTLDPRIQELLRKTLVRSRHCLRLRCGNGSRIHPVRC